MDKYPLLVVRGKNLDRAKQDSANAVGKSLLHSALITLLKETPVLALNKRDAKSMLKNNAKAKITFDNNKTHWQIEQYGKAKSINYYVIRDDKNLEIKGIAAARKQIDLSFPLSREIIYSQMIVSPSRPSVLLLGSGADRLKYFKQMFDLHIYDLMRRRLRQELQSASNAVKLKQNLQNQKTEIVANLPKPITIDKTSLKLRQKQLMDDLTEANRQIQKLTAFITLTCELHSTASASKMKTKLTANKQVLIRVEKIYERLVTKLTNINSNNKKYKQRKKLSSKLKKLPVIKSAGNDDKLRKKLDVLNKQIDLYNEYRIYIKKYHQIKTRAENLTFKPAYLQRKLTEAKHDLRSKINLIKHKKCPTCGHKIDRQHLDNHNKFLRQHINSLNKNLRKAKISEFCRKVEEKLSSTVLQLNLTQASRKLQKIQQQLTINQQANVRQQKRKILLAKLQTIKQVKPVSPLKIKQQLTKYKKRRAKLRDSVAQLEHDIKLLEKLATYDITLSLVDAKTTLHDLKQAVAKSSKKLEKLQEQLNQASQYESDLVAGQKLLLKLNEQIKDAEAASENQTILTALAEAYSVHGVQNDEIALRVELYIQKLNLLSASIYPEPTKFFAQIKGNDCNILVERQKQLSDIRQLSDSERAQFLPISALASISQMPQDYRTSHIFLDEVEANLSVVERKIFAQEFMPILAASVPHTVLITPQSVESMLVNQATEMLLTKKLGQTTVEFRE